MKPSNPFEHILAQVYDSPTEVDIPFIEWVRELFGQHGLTLTQPEDVAAVLKYLEHCGVLQIDLSGPLAVITGIYNYGR